MNLITNQIRGGQIMYLESIIFVGCKYSFSHKTIYFKLNRWIIFLTTMTLIFTLTREYFHFYHCFFHLSLQIYFYQPGCVIYISVFLLTCLYFPRFSRYLWVFYLTNVKIKGTLPCLVLVSLTKLVDWPECPCLFPAWRNAIG